MPVKTSKLLFCLIVDLLSIQVDISYPYIDQIELISLHIELPLLKMIYQYV